MRKTLLLLLLIAGSIVGQAPARVPANVAQANLAQLMRGIRVHNSNVIFVAQSQNPAEIKPAKIQRSPQIPWRALMGSGGG